ncbi:VanZ family protein [Patescibacteria group bacterium]
MGKVNKKEIVIRWIPPIIWSGVIFALSSYSTLPGPKIIWWDFVFKKSAHMFMYAVLFLLIQRSINWKNKIKRYSLSMILTILFAFSDEYHQSFVLGRTALLSDVGYDSLGASLMLLKLKHLI